MQQERRQAGRARRRLEVAFGTAGLDEVGHTRDLSPTGLFVVTRRMLRVGTRLHLKLASTRNFVLAEGVVIRSQPLLPGQDAADLHGLGIRLLSLEEALADVLPPA